MNKMPKAKIKKSVSLEEVLNPVDKDFDKQLKILIDTQNNKTSKVKI